MVARQNIYLVIVAAGSGQRMSPSVPKQYGLLGGMPVLRRTLLVALEARQCFEKILVVIDPAHALLYRQAMEGLPQELFLEPVQGGATRQQSVFAALKALTSLQPEAVVLHDAARPFVTAAQFESVVDALETAPGAICALAVTDTIKRAVNARVSQTVPREDLYAAQTPQAYRFAELYNAHNLAAKEDRIDFTDDAALLEWQNHEVCIVQGSAENFKLTTQDDWKRAEKFLANGNARSAMGFDVHRFTSGDHVMLGGVKIPHSQGIDAHSDGDVILHALTDALLGLAGTGDIGQHFPPTDARWKNASSSVFVKKALTLLQDAGGTLMHCDITLIAEAPKIGPHRQKICAAVGELIGLPALSIGLKATTAEGLGLIGQGEGLCAYVLASAVFGK